MQCGRNLSACDMVVYPSTLELILWKQKSRVGKEWPDNPALNIHKVSAMPETHLTDLSVTSDGIPPSCRRFAKSAMFRWRSFSIFWRSIIRSWFEWSTNKKRDFIWRLLDAFRVMSILTCVICLTNTGWIIWSRCFRIWLFDRWFVWAEKSKKWTPSSHLGKSVFWTYLSVAY